MALDRNKLFKLNNDTRNINSQCKIIIHRWKVKTPQSDTSDKDLGKAVRLDVSSQIMDCDFNKPMGSPSGTFSFTLSNSPNIKGETGDWKDIIRRGDWCVIYGSQDGELVTNPVAGPPLPANTLEEATKIRGICYIERVLPTTSIGERGEFDVTYTISGRDFGIIYEQTEIWHNIFQFDQIMLQSLANNELNVIGNKPLNEILEIIHDLFFNPSNIAGAKVNDNKSLSSIALQWLLPRTLVTDVFGPVSGGTFWGELPLVKRFDTTAAGLAVERPTDFLSGVAWDQLKKASSPHFHELFTETDDLGQPHLTFRPIPFGIDQSKYPALRKHISLFKDIEFIEVPSIDVLENSLSEDDHGRYNSFLATVSTDLYNISDNISVLKGSRFPLFQQTSIKRYGFRPMHVSVDTIIKNAQKDGAQSDRTRLIEFNEVLFDYWNNFIFMSSGTSELIGRNDIKLGVALQFSDDVPSEARKRYYIEGYSDRWEVDEKGTMWWTQQVILTRGLEESDLLEGTRKDDRNTEFAHEGEFTTAGTNKSGSKK